ncbi:MAG TPA: hypothetical protein VFX58_17100 [Chitinophagaceae bacterium]|nr:hypothetical protein [Chitinophagaceae bacterium]
MIPIAIALFVILLVIAINYSSGRRPGEANTGIMANGGTSSSANLDDNSDGANPVDNSNDGGSVSGSDGGADGGGD